MRACDENADSARVEERVVRCAAADAARRRSEKNQTNFAEGRINLFSQPLLRRVAAKQLVELLVVAGRAQRREAARRLEDARALVLRCRQRFMRRDEGSRGAR